jgi:REP-associated tyrosine transposase
MLRYVQFVNNVPYFSHGHLFQNRYKSIVCEEDLYFKELVRYIHLNPLRAGLVDTLAKLDRYMWCGHCVVMKHTKNEWQDRLYVLKWFGRKEKEAKKAYKAFISKGVDLGKRPDLTGGGLIRSMGSWSVVKAMRNSGMKENSDARILGSGAFVSEIIEHAEEKVKYQLPAVELQKRIMEEIEILCKNEKVMVASLQSGSRRPPLPKLRKAITLKLVDEYGVSLAETARKLGISTSGVAQILKRIRNA